MGKTRLAVQVADDVAYSFADDTVFVPLAPISTSNLLPFAIADALQLSFSGQDEPHTQIINYLQGKHMLLVMDNFEHLLDAVDFLISILRAAPQVKTLVTSRERLNIQEEWVFTLDGLAYPADSNFDLLENYSAVQLFMQRARQIQSRFSLKENAAAVGTICRQVEGMPLGLELAASWLRVMPVEQIVTQMANNLDFLTSPLRNVPERHRSLRNVFEHSWRMLSTDEQLVLMRLSVFRGGFDLEAAAQVAGASLLLLAALINKSLVRVNTNGRYDLHERLRQYAGDKLAQAGEADPTAQRHVNYFINLADQAEAHLFGSQQGAWFDRLEAEFDNLRAALAWAKNTEAGLHLAASLGWFFSERIHWNEGAIWLKQILAANANTNPSLRAKALNHAGAIYGLLGDIEASQIFGKQALTLAQAVNDRWNTAWSFSHLAIYPQVHPVEQTATLLEESLALFRQLEDLMGITHTLIRLSWSAFALRDYVYMRQLVAEASIYAHEVGDQITIGWIEYNTGWLCWYQDNNLEQARTHMERSYAIFRATRFHAGANNALMQLALVEQQMGNMMRAQVRNKEALVALSSMAPNHPYFPYLLMQIAGVARESGEFKRAAKLLGAAKNLFNSIPHAVEFVNLEADMGPIQNSIEYFSLETDIAPLRLQLGEAAFNEAWTEGNAMTLKQIMAYVLEDRTTTTDIPLAAAPTRGSALNEREQEILRLLADGLNSREMAEQLFLSVQTIRWYLKNIYSKLDVHSRSEAIARAKALNLLA